MPVSTWPTSLPQVPTVAGYGEGEANNALRTEMDVGPAKVRRRGTAAPRPLNFSMVLTEAQLSAFRSFYRSDLSAGTLPFLLPDPLPVDAEGGSEWLGGWVGEWVGSGEGSAVLVRFVEPPSWSALGRQLYQTTMALEVLP